MTTRAAFLIAALPALLAPLASSRAAQPVQVPPTTGFVPNRGQAPVEVRYYAAIPGGVVYLTEDAIVVDTWQAERGSRLEDNPAIRRVGRATWAGFAGPNPSAVLEGVDGTESRLNFLIGADPSRWCAEVPVYERAMYRNLWPGIDLVLTAEGGLTCNARVGANLAQALFEVREGDGAGSRIVDVDGLSALFPGSGEPEALDNPAALVWSTYIGGSAEEIGWSTTCDPNGNVLVTGLNTSTFFPTTPGAYDRVYSGLGDVFVSKFSADGTTLQWSTFLGGSSPEFDYGYAVSLDPSGNPVVTGYTRSGDYPVTAGAYDTSYNGDADVFVTKLNATGSGLVWSTFIGDTQHDIGYDIDHDSEGNPIVAGRTLSEFYPTTAGAYDVAANGEEDGFVTKLSSAGNALVWSTLFGGSLYDGVQAIEVDASAVPYICGYTASLDFPGGKANGLYDIFVARLSPGGNALSWSRLIGGSSYDYGTDLALDYESNPVVCGSTGSSDFPVTAGAYDETYNGDDDVVAAKLSAADGSPLWATFVGGTIPVYEIAHGVVLDAQDRPILAGTTPSSDFPTTPSGYDTSHNGGGDVFVVRLSASGSALDWGSYFGGPGEDYAFGLALAPGGDVIVTGQADSGYPVTANAYDTSYNGDISDVFVSRVRLASATGVPGGSPAVDPLALAVWPNPIATGARIAFTLPEPASARIEVFDAAGRLRASVHDAPLGPGAHTVDWRAVDRAGRRLPAGVYAVRLTAGPWSRSQRVVLVR